MVCSRSNKWSPTPQGSSRRHKGASISCRTFERNVSASRSQEKHRLIPGEGFAGVAMAAGDQKAKRRGHKMMYTRLHAGLDSKLSKLHVRDSTIRKVRLRSTCWQCHGKVLCRTENDTFFYSCRGLNTLRLLCWTFRGFSGRSDKSFLTWKSD